MSFSVLCRLTVLFILNLLLVACSLSPSAPVPTDQFYRLPAPAVFSGDKSQAIFDGNVFVRSFRSDGLHLERAVLFSTDEDALVLEQHHYHFWYDSPQRMLQNYMVDSLRVTGAAPLVAADPGVKYGYVISPLIKRFERHIKGEKVTALVSLEIQLKRHGAREFLLVKDYSARVAADDSKVSSSIPAFAEGLDRIMQQFSDDVIEILASRSAVSRSE